MTSSAALEGWDQGANQNRLLPTLGAVVLRGSLRSHLRMTDYRSSKVVLAAPVGARAMARHCHVSAKPDCEVRQVVEPALFVAQVRFAKV